MPILPHFGRQKKFFNRHHFLFWQPPIGKNFARSAAGNLSYIASSASGKHIGYAKVFRDKGERATTRYRPQEVPHFASGRSANGTLSIQKIAPATARFFRHCTALRRATWPADAGLPVVRFFIHLGSLIAIVYGKQRKSSENIRDNSLLIDWYSELYKI